MPKNDMKKTGKRPQGGGSRRYLSLCLDGDALRQFERADADGVLRLVVPLGDDTFQVTVTKLRTRYHTLPDEEGGKPSLAEMAEVVGRLFVAVGTGVF